MQAQIPQLRLVHLLRSVHSPDFQIMSELYHHHLAQAVGFLECQQKTRVVQILQIQTLKAGHIHAQVLV